MSIKKAYNELLKQDDTSQGFAKSRQNVNTRTMAWVDSI